MAGEVSPPLTPFSEIADGTMLALGSGRWLTFAHYNSCREVTVAGGKLTVGRLRYEVTGGRIEREVRQDCPKEFQAQKTGARAGGLVPRAGPRGRQHPRTLVTDRWRAYAAAFRDLGLTGWHHQAKWKNNRIESAHVAVRRRERKMQKFRSPGFAQRFLSIHAAVYDTLNTRRHLVTAAEHREGRHRAFDLCRVAAKSAA